MTKKHFCVSAYVISSERKKVLMVLHKKLQKWLPIGGHIEEDEDPEEAIAREVMEEVGLKVKLIGARYPRQSDLVMPIAMQRNVINVHRTILKKPTIQIG